MTWIRQLLAAFSLCLIGACSGETAPAVPSVSPNPTLTASLESPAPVEIPSSEGATDSGALEEEAPTSQYSFEVLLDLDAQQIAVDERIAYVNAGGETLSELLLVVEALLRGGDFRLEELAWANGQSVGDYTLEAGLLRIPLPDALRPGASLGLVLDYTLALPPEAGQLGYTGRQSNFVDWYPFIPPYQEGQGWVVHPRAAVGEHLVYESADFEVSIRVRGEQQAQIAAPAPGEAIEGGWFYRLEGARRFAWSASRQYETISRTVDGIPITAYVYAEHRLAGEAAVETCAGALRHFQSLFGEYPYESLAIVEGDFPDGLESDALFFLYRGFFEAYKGGPQNYLTTLSAHEVSHNWWFGQVGNDPALEPWLDEALAIYSERLYYEDLAASLVDWWWQFRVLDYSPAGRVDSTIYDHEAFAPYVHAVYMRGALFLEDLREMMGDEAFFEFLRRYAKEGGGRIQSGDDFFGMASEFGGDELGPLLDEYFAP